ncbi:MAG: hypothetical protein J0H72_18805 [Burkholderiales bacterium]|nr:hypothetical protein [Burkholderiales bacterium]
MMLEWLRRWVLSHAPTPEREAEKALNEARLALYRAEQRVRDAIMYAEYYRERVSFLKRVKEEGIENVTDVRAMRPYAGQAGSSQATLRLHPKAVTNE